MVGMISFGEEGWQVPSPLLTVPNITAQKDQHSGWQHKVGMWCQGISYHIADHCLHQPVIGVKYHFTSVDNEGWRMTHRSSHGWGGDFESTA